MNQIEVNEFRKLIFEILKYVDSYCTENNIRYSLNGGTLLGAVRHKGFIPWDDDIDIMMPRPDYEQFLKTFNNQNSDFKVISSTNNKQYFFPFAKVVNTKTFLTEGYDRPIDQMGVNIDVFPVDGLPNDKTQCEKYWEKMKILRKLSTYVYVKNDWREHGIKKFVRYFFFYTLYFFPANFLSNILNAIAKKNNFNNSVFVAKTVFSGYGKKETIQKEVFNHYVLLDFENQKFKSLEDYSTYLTNLFGNYMELPPEEKRIRKHGWIAYWR